jgi:hypothetical protein
MIVWLSVSGRGEGRGERCVIMGSFRGVNECCMAYEGRGRRSRRFDDAGIRGDSMASAFEACRDGKRGTSSPKGARGQVFWRQLGGLIARKGDRCAALQLGGKAAAG